MRIGAHLPTRGSLESVVGIARDVGAEAVQLFVSNPRAWAPRRYPPEDVAAFRERFAAEGLGPLFIHSTYLVNVASPKPEFLAKSVRSAREDLEVAAEIGAYGLVVHAGAGGATERGEAVDRAAASLRAIADGVATASGGPAVVIELTAGGIGTVASTLPEARELFDALGDDPRFALCLDTCHLFAAGYALDEPEGVAVCFAELSRLRLASRLRLVHANDAAFPRGSRRDRHARIGEGHIGEEGFRAILAQPAVRRAAVLIETPGTLEDHRRNIEALRRLAAPSTTRPARTRTSR